jgi:hypothetical protein
MPRYIRNTVILAKVETTAGTDAVPTGAANAVLVTEMSIDPLDAANVQRKVVRGYFGASEELVGPASVKVSLTVELAGSGTAATPPALGALLRGCGVAEGVLATPARVEYTPVSTAQETLTIYYYDDGALHKLTGVMGNCTLNAKIGDRGVLKFDFVGLDAGLSAATPSGTSFSAWKKPVAISKANVTDIILGGSYAAGAITGGTPYSSTGLDLMLGNTVNFTPLLSSESVDITDRESTGGIELDLTAAQEVAFMTSVKTNLTQGLAFTIGTASGNKVLIYGSNVQLTKPKKVERNGRRLIGYDLRFIPSAAGAGNDEWRLVFL